MKRVLLFCFICMTVLDVHAGTNDSAKAVQPFTAVGWTTTTLHSPSGKASVFVRRTVYTRDASGNTRREMYQPTKGVEHDIAASLERVETGKTSADALPTVQWNKERTEEDVDLGASQFSGLATTGRRRTFQDVSGQRTRTLETWFCATLGLTVRMESRNARGDSTVTELSELHLGEPDAASANTAVAAKAPVPALILYRSLFTHIAHLERDRLANDPAIHINLTEVEESLRKTIGLSAKEWQAVLEKSVAVESYTRERSKEARSFADQDRAARKENPGTANTKAVARATLHRMQADLNSHIQGEIDELKASVGANATQRIEAYLQGPVAASTSAVPFREVQMRAQKERAK